MREELGGRMRKELRVRMRGELKEGRIRRRTGRRKMREELEEIGKNWEEQG